VARSEGWTPLLLHLAGCFVTKWLIGCCMKPCLLVHRRRLVLEAAAQELLAHVGPLQGPSGRGTLAVVDTSQWGALPRSAATAVQQLRQ